MATIQPVASAASRITGIAPVPSLPWGAHLCVFYDSPADMLGIVGSFFKAGLEANERCLAVASGQSGADELRASLRRAIPAFDDRTASEAIRIISSEELYGGPGEFDRERTLAFLREEVAKARALGFSGLRGSGDEEWLRRGDWEDFSEYEATLESLVHEESLLILCAYPAANLSASDVLSVARSHDVVLARHDGKWQVLERPAGESHLQLEGYRAELERRVLEHGRSESLLSARLEEEAAERKRLQHEVDAGEKRFAAVIAATPFMVAIVRRADERIVEVNDPFLRKLGYQRHEVAGRTALELGLWADAREHDDVLAALETGGRIDGCEVTVRRKDGRPLELALHAHLLEQRHEACVVYSMFDQTELKGAERALVEHRWLLNESERLSRTGSWQWNLADGSASWSDELYRLHGQPRRAFRPSFDAWLGLVHPEDRERVRTVIRAAIREHGSYSVQHRIVMPDGGIRHMRSVGYRPSDDKQAPDRIMGYATDVTELHDAMAQLRATLRKLVDLQEMSQRRLAGELHDSVGQNLTAIAINLQTMQAHARSANAGSALTGRIDDSMRLVGMATASVVDILGDLRQPVLDRRDLVPAIRQYAATYARRTGVEVDFAPGTAAERLPPDWPAAIYRIVQEGLINIAKHAQARHAWVRFAEAPAIITVVVEDDGVGLERAGQRATSTSGFGLVSIRERVIALGGRFHVGARAGGGTRLEIEVPLESPDGP